MGAAPDESADVVEDVVESVVSDSASDTGISSLARFIPTPMDDDLLVLIRWTGVIISKSCSVIWLLS
jgi:hypothetical protein